MTEVHDGQQAGQQRMWPIHLCPWWCREQVQGVTGAPSNAYFASTPTAVVYHR